MSSALSSFHFILIRILSNWLTFPWTLFHRQTAAAAADHQTHLTIMIFFQFCYVTFNFSALRRTIAAVVVHHRWCCGDSKDCWALNIECASFSIDDNCAGGALLLSSSSIKHSQLSIFISCCCYLSCARESAAVLDAALNPLISWRPSAHTRGKVFELNSFA